jgi:hypothetical protein
MLLIIKNIDAQAKEGKASLKDRAKEVLEKVSKSRQKCRDVHGMSLHFLFRLFWESSSFFVFVTFASDSPLVPIH